MGKYLYQLFGLKVQTNLDLGDLPKARAGKPAVRIVWKIGSAPTTPSSWYHRNRFEDGSLFCSFGRLGDRFFIRSHGRGDFVYSNRTKMARVYSRSRESIANAQTLILNQVLPFVLSLEGYQVLHASAVSKKGKAIVFLGETGLGKSTLAGAFALSGYSLLTDDALPIVIQGKKIFALPSFPEVRLDSIAGAALMGETKYLEFAKAFHKRRVGFMSRDNLKGVEIKKVFVLTDARRKRCEPSFQALDPRQAWLSLMEHSFRVDLLNKKRMRREMVLLTMMAEQIEFSKISYLRRFHGLPSVISALENRL